uniref:Uncharacterized protein LOC111110801 n=1 Tax=Crassostrea virginica TaxID=6565 RepID=A0A8B8BJJ9_CRAVI|nr:uncharacterized protein LOC111110801 [Crassostrea virginica]
MLGIITFMMLTEALANANTGNCKDMLQGYLTGQLSSALGAYQVEALRREFKSFTDVIEKSMKLFEDKINADMKAVKDAGNNSVVYTRWGKKTCSTNAELVYSGYAGGSHHTHTGAAVDPLCLPRDPEWGIYKDGIETYISIVYGAEYETFGVSGYMSTLQNHDVPCAVCLVRERSIVKMFPARKACFKGWKVEYQGYLMAGYHGFAAGTMYTCVDSHPDTLHGGRSDKNGYLFYPVEGQCGSLKCPPYVEGRELTCVVCSKE